MKKIDHLRAVIMNGINKSIDHAMEHNEKDPAVVLEVISMLDDVMLYISDFTSPTPDMEEEEAEPMFFSRLEDDEG